MHLWILCTSIFLSAMICNELIADYLKLLSCGWPKSPEPESALRAMILADTHILGPRGHWLDKFYREWHMHRAFQAAIALFKPEVIFVLGDLFDEGDLIDHMQFKEHVERFWKHFRTPKGVRIICAVGNHDVGFHYKMHPFFTNRFENNFNNSGVKLYTLKGTHFVFINSMAMETDGCYFCDEALRNLNKVNSTLNCLKRGESCDDRVVFEEHKSYSRPVLMQHFPTYRSSDAVCREHDAPVLQNNRESWEVLSKQSTDLLGELLSPRVAFAGHSHHYCVNINRMNIEEYTVASFNWRNKPNPSFLLVTFTTTSHAVTKCDMLPQQVVYNTYLLAIICITIVVLVKIYTNFRNVEHKKVT